VVQLTVLYHKANDPVQFAEYYFSTHAPIARRIPGLRTYTVSDGAVNAPDRSPSKYELIAQLVFDSQQALGEALTSPEGQAAVDDLQNFATNGVTIVAFETREL